MEPRGHELRSARVEPFGAEVIAGVAAQLMKEHRLGSSAASAWASKRRESIACSGATRTYPGGRASTVASGSIVRRSRDRWLCRVVTGEPG